MAAIAKLIINQPLPAKAPVLNVQVPFSFSIQGDPSQGCDVQWRMRLQNDCPATLINFNDGTSQLMGSPICGYAEGDLPSGGISHWHHINAGETWTPRVAGLTFETLATGISQEIVLEVVCRVEPPQDYITDTLTMQIDVGEFRLTIDRPSLILPTSGQKNAGLDFSLTIQNTGDFFAEAGWAIKSWDGNPGPVILENVPNSGFGRSVESGELLIPLTVFLHPLDTSEAWSSDHGLYTVTSRLYFMKAGTYHFTLQALLGSIRGDLLDKEHIGLTALDSVDFTVNITESSIPNEWTIAELHAIAKNGQEMKSRYPVDNQDLYPLGEIYFIFWYQLGSGRWKGTIRGSPLRLAIHTKNIGGMMWGWGPGVTAAYYTMNCELCYGDASFLLSTEQKAIVNVQLGDPIPARVQVRVYDESGQLMPTMQCIINTNGTCAGGCPPEYNPLSDSHNTNEWVIPRVDDYHVEAACFSNASCQPEINVTAKVSVNKEYTKTLWVVPGWDTYIDFHIEPSPPPGKGNLEVHAYENGSEVEASVEIIGIGTRTTPFVEFLDPGSYDLTITFKGVTKTDTVVIVASETTRTEYSFTAAPSDGFPFKNLARFPRLYKFVYGIWLKRKKA